MTKKAKRNLLATAMYTISSIYDGQNGQDGKPGTPGAPGEDKEYYDYSFMDGIKYWSTSYSTYTKPGTNVKVIGSAESKLGKNVLEIQNEIWLYSKNHIPIEQNKIYRFSFRVKQTVDPLNGSDKNKVYAGATTFDANGARLSVNNGTYFIASSQSITVANGWKEYTVYMSTTSKSAIINGSNKTLCPAVKAFDSGTKTIKPMFIVNYSAGNGIVQVDGLKMEDYTQEWNALYELRNKLDSDSQSVFDALTDGGRIQGIYMKDGQLYINGKYINAYNLRVLDKSGNLTLGIDENGNVTIRATSLNIGSKPVASKDDINTSINNIQIGGRNMTPNTGFFNDLEGWQAFNQATNLTIVNGRFSEDSKAAQVNLANVAGSGIRTPNCYCIAGNKYVTSFWIKVSKACRVGQLLKFIDINNAESNPISAEYKNVSANTWTYIEQKFTAPSTAVKFASTPRIESAIGADVTFAVTEFKAEEGTKGTTWSPAPEDIDDGKISVGGAISDVNNSNGQIQYPKLNISGMIRFTDFDKDLAKHYVIKRNEQGEVIETTINGATIETGSVTADQMTMYNLSVVRRRKRPHNSTIDKDCTITGEHFHWEDIDTSFNVSEEGNIKASGTFSSFNFNNITQDEGWQINEEGDSVFNNTVIRGRVELPNAGVTDHGGGDGQQLLLNTDFKKYVTKTNVGWDNSLNGTIVPDVWYYYNSGVTNPNKGYHANLDIETFGYPVGRFINKNSTIGQTNRWMALSQSISTNRYIFKAKTKYTFSFEIFADTEGMKVFGGLHYKKTGETSSGFHSGQYSYYTTQDDVHAKQWRKVIYTFETAGNMDTNVAPSIYIYGYGGAEGIMYVRYPKLEEGEKSHNWSPEPDLIPYQTRIWAGESYNNRDNAPFRVLHNGTVIATRGEFGGTFTGRIEIGNIKIHDTNDTPGVIEIKNKDDKLTIVKVAENESFFSSPLFIGVPNPATGQPSASFKFNPAEKRLEVLSGGVIDVGSTSKTKLALINSSTGSYMKLGTNIKVEGSDNNFNILAEDSGKINIKIGNFISKASGDGSNSDASLLIDGHIETKTIAIGPARIFESPDKDGIDFYID